MKTRPIILAIFIALSVPITLGSCTHKVGLAKLQNETMESLSQKIIKEKSTKADILKEFGKPTDTTQNTNGTETWTYRLEEVFLAPAYSSAKIKTLRVTFNLNETVADYSLSDSKS